MILKKIKINEKWFVALKLDGPETVIGPLDRNHNYEADPYGPGTIGFGKSQEEIGNLKDNYLLIEEKGLEDLRRKNLEAEEATQKLREKYKEISSFKMNAMRVVPDGVLTGEITDGESLNYGGLYSKEIDHKRITKDLEDLFK